MRYLQTTTSGEIVNQTTHNRLVSFIWSIADDCLRDIYVRGKYRDVILPMVVLRRLDALLVPTKERVLEEVKFQREDVGLTEYEVGGLRDASGYLFYNTSPWTLKRLYDTATNSQLFFFLLFVNCLVNSGYALLVATSTKEKLKN